VEINEVPSSSLFSEPQIQALAEKLKACLDELLGNGVAKRKFPHVALEYLRFPVVGVPTACPQTVVQQMENIYRLHLAQIIHLERMIAYLKQL